MKTMGSLRVSEITKIIHMCCISWNNNYFALMSSWAFSFALGHS
jgi:hypothetical protein